MTVSDASALPRSRVRARAGGTELSALGWPMLGLLSVQFLFGIGLNLFVVLPTGNPGGILLSSPLLVLHVVLAALLIGISARTVVLAARQKDPVGRVASVLSLVSALVATAAGLSFTFGPGAAEASFAMSVGFVGMLVGAGLLIRLGREQARDQRKKAIAGTEVGRTDA